jgi:nucleotide-binding universal stress UspA family protein
MTEKETQFTTIVVPLDGSDFAAQALPVAVALASASNAGLRLVGIAHDEGQLAWVQRHVHGAARQVASTSAPEVDVILDPDPARVLLGVAADGSKVLCFASHDYGRVAAKVMHSVGSAIIARAPHPVVVTGARAAPSSWATDVVVAVDGVNDPQPLLATASGWARRMQAPLRIVTVYEPVPADLNRPTHFTRHHGPPGDPHEYLEAIQRHADQHGLASTSTASIADPISVASGIVEHLASRPALLLVAGASHHVGPHVGPGAGTLRDLLRMVLAPVLVDPRHDRGARRGSDVQPGRRP